MSIYQAAVGFVSETAAQARQKASGYEGDTGFI